MLNTVEPARTLARTPAADEQRSPAPGARHLKHVEGLRALAALVVYLNHAYGQAFLNTSATPPGGLLSLAGYSMVAGHLAVTVFIVISGFCLTLPVVAAGDRLRGGAAQFFKRRARRILPAYYGSLALALALIWTVIGEPTGTLWDVPIWVTPSSIVSHLLLLQDFFGTSRINYVLWSIAVEWHIYFLFPLLVWGWRRFGPRATILSALVLGYGLYFGFHSTRIARSNSHFVGLFTLGMLAAYSTASTEAWYRRLRHEWPWRAICATTLSLAAVLTWWWGIESATARFAFLDLPVGIGAMALLIVSSREDGGLLNRVFSWKPLVVLGTFSYSVYLIHAPLLQLLWQYGSQPAGFSPRETFWFLMTAGLGVTVLTSYGFYRVFEAPFMGRAAASRREQPMPAALGAGVA